jgi:futalosine hydrolase
MIQERLVDTSINPINTNIHILIVTSVEAEKNAIEKGLGNLSYVDVKIVGVGPISAAVETAKHIANKKYDLVICAGIAGGFATHTSIGSLVIADKIIAADLGAQSPDGFLSLEDLQLGTTCVSSPISAIDCMKNSFSQTYGNVMIGSILTLSTVTGTDTTCNQLANRFPYAVAEAMEGFGVASAAHSYSIPSMEIRAISNHIGPRDKSKWRIREALDELTKLGSIMKNFTNAWKIILQKEASKP